MLSTAHLHTQYGSVWAAGASQYKVIVNDVSPHGQGYGQIDLPGYNVAAPSHFYTAWDTP